MGVYQSSFEKTDAQSKIMFNPSKADWVTGHADLTGLAVVEVERLWNRFRQMGADKNGNVPQKILDKGELGQDIFTKNILNNLPKERDGGLSFVVFLRFMQWADNSDIDAKLKVLFNFLNNGKDLDSGVISKLLKRIYPNCDDAEIREITDIFMTQMDDRKTGRINESQFVYNIKRIASPNQLKEFLSFNIIPGELLEEVNMQPSLNGSMLSVRNTRMDNNTSIRDRITDEQLDLVTSKVIKKNWEQLMFKLGYLEYDIESTKTQNRGNTYNVVLELLKQWRDQDPYLATPSRLKRYLEECGMIDAAIVLDS